MLATLHRNPLNLNKSVFKWPTWNSFSWNALMRPKKKIPDKALKIKDKLTS